MTRRYCRSCQQELQTCAVCKGKGEVYRSTTFGGGGMERCKGCGGSGKVCPKHGANYG